MSHLGYEIKKLGFGLMRLPKRGDNIDVEQVKIMVDRFLADGFTYFDTAWAYPGSEDAIRQALVERHPREAFQLATKNAAWIKCKSREEAIGQFETSLRQTARAILTSTCCTTLEKAAPASLTFSTCGTSFRRKSGRGSSGMWDSPSTPGRRNWSRFCPRTRKWNSCNCK